MPTEMVIPRLPPKKNLSFSSFFFLPLRFLVLRDGNSGQFGCFALQFVCDETIPRWFAYGVEWDGFQNIASFSVIVYGFVILMSMMCEVVGDVLGALGVKSILR